MACNGLWYFQIDEQLASGEYFMSQKKKTTKKWQDKQEKQAQKTAENKRKREAAFIPPEEVFLKLFHSILFHFIEVLIPACLLDPLFYPNDFYQFWLTILGGKKPGYKI